MIRVKEKTVKARNMNFRYCRDEICANYNFFDNTYSIFFNGEEVTEFENSTPCNFIRDLNKIAEMLHEDERFICYVNNLSAAIPMLPAGVKNDYINAKGETIISWYRTDKFEFREYEMFARNSSYKSCHARKMFSFLRSMASMIEKTNICDLPWSAGKVTKKALTIGLDEKIKQWYFDNKNYRDSIEEYKEQLIGCKSGLLKAMEGVYDDILMVDIKSAYISAFIQLDNFPIGRLIRSIGKKALINFLNGNWYHIILKTSEPVEDFSEFVSDNDKCTYGFYKYDENVFWDNGTNFKKKIMDLIENHGAELICYDCSTYGPILREVKDRIVDFYNLKQEKKGTEFGDSYKIITEYIYGKALHKKEFESNSKCNNYFKLAENIIRPEYSMLVCSFIRWRLSRTIKELGGCYYNDTDGIETQYSEENEKLMQEKNHKIIEFNKSVGYDTNMGTYEVEAKHAKIGIIGKKQRIFIDDEGKLTIKLAGVPSSSFDWLVKKLNLSDDELFNYITRGCTAIINVFGFNSKQGYYEIPQKITLQGCYQEGCGK